MLEDFRHVRRFATRYDEIDMMLHVNHAAYVLWAQAAHADYLCEVIGSDLRGKQGVILVKLEWNYEHPLDYRETVALGTRVSRIGNKSLDFSYEIWSETRVVRAAYGHATLVAFDYESNVSIAVPADWRAKVVAYERTPFSTP